MESLKKPVILSSSPHFHSRYTTEQAMNEVFFACLPAAAAGVWFFGLNAVLAMILCVAGAKISDMLCQWIMKRPYKWEGSAVVTGILLAMCLPPSIPLWIAFLGGVFAIVIGKQVFGGLGQNIFNPAHIGRAILLASFPVYMSTWVPARGAVDAVTTATPLFLLKHGATGELPSLFQAFVGQTGGCIGETCVPAILVGGIFLIWRKHIDWRIPSTYLGSVLVLTAAYGGVMGYSITYPVYQLFGGGLLLGAFFMATDWVTSPVTKNGRLIFGVGLGIMTCMIRFFGGLSEGVCYSILIMNILTPMIDRYTRGTIFGVARKKAVSNEK
ncbi:MAG: RnfABCDGE type electron transport complex subunit D [Peptococcaceae bacterium]|jgi:electron transport complex protein RnfD|nr:RnfABCDGE type electron transport complex subunit D [Peptococcaceae bacterium]